MSTLKPINVNAPLLSPKFFPKSKFARDFFLYKGLDYYNSIPSDILKCEPRVFKKKGFKYIKSNCDVH